MWRGSGRDCSTPNYVFFFFVKNVIKNFLNRAKDDQSLSLSIKKLVQAKSFSDLVSRLKSSQTFGRFNL